MYISHLNLKGVLFHSNSSYLWVNLPHLLLFDNFDYYLQDTMVLGEKINQSCRFVCLTLQLYDVYILVNNSLVVTCTSVFQVTLKMTRIQFLNVGLISSARRSSLRPRCTWLSQSRYEVSEVAYEKR